MTFSIPVKCLTPEMKDLISKSCKISLTDPFTGTKQTTYAYNTVRIDGIKYANLPIGMWREFVGKFPNKHAKFSESLECSKELYTIKTDPKGYRDQDVVVKEILSKFQERNSALLAANPGFGKCLHPDTSVLLSDGSEMLAKNIRTGMRLMGDDSKPRLVSSTCTGIETMYKIALENSEYLIVNGPHILTLKFINNRRIVKRNDKFVFDYVHQNNFKASPEFPDYDTIDAYRRGLPDPNGGVIDIELNRYLQLDPHIRDNLSFYCCSYELPERSIDYLPYQAGKELKNIDRVRLNSIRIRKEYLRGVFDGSFCMKKGADYYIHTNMSGILDRLSKLARSVGYNSMLIGQELIINTESSRQSRITSVSSIGNGEYCGFTIDGNGRFLLSNTYVTHNTTIGNYITCQLGLKTLILCHIDTVRRQWVDEFKKFSNATVQHVTGKKMKEDAHIYIMGVLKAANFERESFTDIGLVIYDEAHICTETAFTNVLQKISPKYLLGLTATPERADKLHKILTPFFGKKSEWIWRSETKDFNVIQVYTGVKPEVKYNIFYGQTKLDWTRLVNSLAANEKRNEIILDLIEKNLVNPINKSKNGILILSDRNSCCEWLYSKCIERGISTSLLIGNSKKYDPDCNVLIAGMKKAGVGFDDPTRNMLILATDVKNVQQYEGRIRVSNNTIFDIVDDYKTLYNHSKIREEWFEKRGAVMTKLFLNNSEANFKNCGKSSSHQQRYNLPPRFLANKNNVESL